MGEGEVGGAGPPLFPFRFYRASVEPFPQFFFFWYSEAPFEDGLPWFPMEFHVHFFTFLFAWVRAHARVEVRGHFVGVSGLELRSSGLALATEPSSP